ncbi:hypothetical protein R7007_21675 [Vibrio sp. 1636]|uniref:Uncharacterized protein n=1 Tax=Vibrio alginolyticus TaxID=663 RepID=A0A7Y0MZE6_VIBAL|nr:MULTISPECIES: hypothetical protein [Vibrio]MDW2204282.1 hypothetical protein [Vibrio sp. 1636]NMR76218.1 hypothetical protein [Vibrio alginolyticus]
MGWGYCGHDKQGREIGYSVAAICDHEECNKEIDRGLSYACGDMHGETEYGCEKYFCSEHLDNTVADEGSFNSICDDCAKALVDSREWRHDDDEGCLVRIVDV